MTKEEKTRIIEDLAQQLNETPHFYLTDASGLNAADTSALRRLCFNNNIKLVVVKNTLLSKAFDKIDKEVEELKPALKQPTAIMFSEVGNAPAKLIKDFRSKNGEKPLLKAAYVEESIYFGDNQLEALVNVKSKDELLGDLIALLKSPINTVMSQLSSGKNLLAGLTKALSER
ncbi:MAG: 50S ribosomal protein L10 [Bacteroidales bacterium]|nr:50S ribosomal protein L10 [Bacteroidales bacterium]